MLVSLVKIKKYLGLYGTSVSLNFDIDATAKTLTRASGDWASSGVAVGKTLLLAGFTNPLNNVQVTVTNVTALIVTFSETGLVNATGSGTSFQVATGAYDEFLTNEEEVVSQAVENYCGRKFLQADYTQIFYMDDYRNGTNTLDLFHYPLVEVTSAVEEDTDIIDDLRIQYQMARLKVPEGFFLNGNQVEIEYTAGFEELPAPVESVILSLVQERYNKKVNGVDLNFGNNVQSVTIPGTIAVQFDYSLQANQRSTAFGNIIGSNANILDFYRSDRRILGSGVCYVNVN